MVSSVGIEGPGALSIEPFEDGFVGAYHGWTNGVGSDNTQFRSLIVGALSLDGGRPAIAVGLPPVESRRVW